MLQWEPGHPQVKSQLPNSFSSVTLIILSFLKMTSRKDKPLLLRAMLGSKDELVVMQLFCDENVKKSYSVSLYVADIKVAKSKKSKSQSSVVKLEWKENNQM